MAQAKCPQCSKEVGDAFAKQSESKSKVLKTGKVGLFHTPRDGSGDHHFSIPLPDDPAERERLFKQLDIS